MYSTGSCSQGLSVQSVVMVKSFATETHEYTPVRGSQIVFCHEICCDGGMHVWCCWDSFNVTSLHSPESFLWSPEVSRRWDVFPRSPGMCSITQQLIHFVERKRTLGLSLKTCWNHPFKPFCLVFSNLDTGFELIHCMKANLFAWLRRASKFFGM